MLVSVDTDETPTCRVCGKPAVVLIAEPAQWLCQECADRLGSEALDPPQS